MAVISYATGNCLNGKFYVGFLRIYRIYHGNGFPMWLRDTSSPSPQFYTVLNLLTSGKLCMIYPKMAFISKWEQNQVPDSLSASVMRHHVGFFAVLKNVNTVACGSVE